MSERVDPLVVFGTEEPPPLRRTLCAGSLSIGFEDGNLRTIRYGGIEVVRSINYLARDSAWGTYKAELSNIAIEEGEGEFTVNYDGLCKGSEGCFAYRMKIRGEASGRLVVEAVGEAITDFPTNRTGFVVLYPSEVAGSRLTILHSDGCVEETAFPEAISPDQPAFDIAALTHEPASGLVCTVTMEGDAFEMEDQRNWADASFKTYVRPLSKPRPYRIDKGERDLQKVTVIVEGRPSDPVKEEAGPSSLAIGDPIGKMPALALFLDLDDLAPALANAAALGPAQSLVVRFDPARGHDGIALGHAARLASALGATLSVEVVFDARDAAGEAAVVAAAMRQGKVNPEGLLVAPRRDFKTRASNTLPAGECPIEELVTALRAGGIGARIGAGTPSFFTEFNRNPPSGSADFVFFSVASNVHAADDISILETLTAYPAIIACARRLCPGKPIWLGPCTIAMQHNPYGASLADNADRTRKPGVGDDPRHGAIFGAAFVAGVAAATNEAVERLIIAAPTGPFGLLDNAFRPRPIRDIHTLLARAAGAKRVGVAANRENTAALAFLDGEIVYVLLANLTPTTAQFLRPAGLVHVSLVGESTNRPSLGSGRTFDVPAYRIALLAVH